MNYCIVNRIELVDGEVKHTPVGYVTDENDCNTLNSNYESTLGDWLRNNISGLENGTTLLSEYFNVTPINYNAYQTTTNIDGMGLSLINDINNIE